MEMKRMLVWSLAAALVMSAGVLPAGAAEADAAEADAAAVAVAKPKKELKEVTFSVSMHCEKCVTKITENISFEKGVKDLEVSLENHTVRIRYDASKTSEQVLKEAIEKLGYEVSKI